MNHLLWAFTGSGINDDLPGSFAELDAGEVGREETVRGYRVRVKKAKSALNECVERRATVARVIARSIVDQ